MKYTGLIGREYVAVITHIGFSNDYITCKIELPESMNGLYYANPIKHITIACANNSSPINSPSALSQIPANTIFDLTEYRIEVGMALGVMTK